MKLALGSQMTEIFYRVPARTIRTFRSVALMSEGIAAER
jgi:hypothetical protein